MTLPKVYGTLIQEKGKADQFVFWCQYCHKEHTHGGGSGTRTAHCTGDTPFRETGYELVVDRVEIV